MKRQFNPEAKPATFRGKKLYEVDCRQWAAELKTLGHPVRRRFESLEDAQTWCRRLVVDHSVGRPTDPGPVAVRSLFDLYLKSIEASGASPTTVKSYESRGKTFLSFLAKHRVDDVRQVSPVMIEMLRADMHARGVGPHGIRGVLSTAKGMFTWANKMGYVVGNSVDGLVPPTPKSERRAFTDEERETLLRDGDPELVPLWVLFFLTGIRRIEAIRLRPEDAQLETPAPFLRVHGKGDKWRTVPLTGRAQAAVRHFLYQGNDMLLPWTYEQTYRLWVIERDRLKLPRDLNVHSFRHTFLSWLATRTGTPLTEVQRVAGHSSVAVTQVYVHADESMLRAGMAQLDEDLVSRWYQTDEENRASQAG